MLTHSLHEAYPLRFLVNILFFFLYLVNVSIDYSHSCDVDNVAYRTFEVGEVDRLVETHLNRTDDLGVRIQSLQQFVATLSTAHIGEYKSVYIQSLQACERILAVTKLLVESEVNLHLTIDDHIGIT